MNPPLYPRGPFEPRGHPRAIQMAALLIAGGSLAGAQEPAESVVAPLIDSVGLFKNGLTVIRASFPTTGPGVYRWNEIPRVVHGTFWIESDARVTVRTTTRLVEEVDATERPTGILQRDLAGRPVTIHLKSEGSDQPRSLTGTVWNIPDPPVTRQWDASYGATDPFLSAWTRRPAESAGSAAPTTGAFLVVEADGGSRHYVALSSIDRIDSSGPFTPAKRAVEKPVILFDVAGPPNARPTVKVTWLSRGMAWAPGYHLDISQPAKLTIRQSAIIRNELLSLANTEVDLISGFPNIRFGHVDSPLWPGTSLAGFFQQLNQQRGGDASVMTQQALVLSNRARLGEGVDLPALDEGGTASGDIHHHGIGRRTLALGDALSLEVASATADYERVVEWTVPDPRDDHGRYRNTGPRTESDDEHAAWDAVRFNNPFLFPMTTASAVIAEKGRFRGESLSGWTNPSQRTSIRITRALSVRTEHNEIEEEAQREVVWVAGNDYQRTNAKATVRLRNYRSTEVRAVVRAEFSGELLEAEGGPEATLRTEGMASVNPRRRLEWTLTLGPGAEKALAYRYRVLVDR